MTQAEPVDKAAETGDLLKIGMKNDARQEFSGKVAVVTGAAGGICKAGPLMFHARGPQVIAEDRNPEVGSPISSIRSSKMARLPVQSWTGHIDQACGTTREITEVVAFLASRASHRVGSVVMVDGEMPVVTDSPMSQATANRMKAGPWSRST